MSIPRSLATIAREIRNDWVKRHTSPAKPYLDAMGQLNALSDRFGQDKAADIVRYFLCNANGWKGETARRVKAELNAMLAAHENV